MTKELSVGVVGCGYWGPNLIRNFRELPDCRLRLMCDVVPERLKHLSALHPGVETTGDFRDLIERSDLDAVVVATPVREHFKMAKAALEAGKHVLMEKPMAASSAECEELNHLARRANLVLMVGHTFLYSMPVRKIREIIASKDVGEIQYINARRLNLGLFQTDINVAWDLAPHDLSIILYLMDESPVSVNCHGSGHVSSRVEDVTHMCLTFGNGRMATIHNSWLEPRKVREMTIVGTKRMIVYDDVEPLEKVSIYDSRVEVPPHYDNFGEFQYSYHYGDRYVPRIPQTEPLKLQCAHFLSCIRSGATPLSNGRHGLEVVRILEAANESLRRAGAAVNLEPPASSNGGFKTDKDVKPTSFEYVRA